MGFRKLLEMSDKQIREEIGEYYFISKSRMDNYLYCLEEQAKKIRENNIKISELIDENNKLKEQIEEYKEMV